MLAKYFVLEYDFSNLVFFTEVEIFEVFFKEDFRDLLFSFVINFLLNKDLVDYQVFFLDTFIFSKYDVKRNGYKIVPST